MSKNNIVKLTIDIQNPPALTDKERKELGTVAAMTDDQIDTSDAPFNPGAIWMKAVNFHHGKKLISLRIDEDVLDFFKHTGKRYQSRINAVLRSYIEAQKAHVK